MSLCLNRAMKTASNLPAPVRQFFESTPLLSQLCDQNGWPDEDSIEVIEIGVRDNQSFFEVRFEEILKEGSGCECGRNRCWGQISLQLSDEGEVVEARVTMGRRS